LQGLPEGQEEVVFYSVWWGGCGGCLGKTSWGAVFGQ
jgi:hypothetical protein